jgi:hypothetical protein
MWSRPFLWTGLVSGFAVAALALGALWLALYLGTNGKDPGWTFANVVKFALPGLIVYPACWYAVVFRRRDYALSRTMWLVLVTFGVVCIVVGAFLVAGGLYVAVDTLLTAPHPWKALWFAAAAPFAYAFLTAFGAALLIIPYAIIATPMALLHRWLLLRAFPASR